jgi:hypothetical protein
MSSASDAPLGRPKSSASSSRMPASRARTLRNTSVSTRLSMRFMRRPICRVIASTIAGRFSIVRWNTATGICHTRAGWTATAKLSRANSPKAGSSPNTSPGAT